MLLQSGEGKGTVLEIRFPCFTQSDKIMIPVDYNKSHVYIIMPRGNTENIISRYMLKNTINESRWNLKTC